MLGYTGAGKTTAAEIIAQLTGAIHLASDRMRLDIFKKTQLSRQEHQQLYKTIDKKTEELLAAGKSIIYDANLNKLAYREEKYAIAKRTNAKVVLIWVKVTKPLAKLRATKSQDSERRPLGNLGEETFERVVAETEQPSESEKPIELDGMDVTQASVKQALKI